jgi:hypothetical protein
VEAPSVQVATIPIHSLPETGLAHALGRVVHSLARRVPSIPGPLTTTAESLSSPMVVRSPRPSPVRTIPVGSARASLLGGPPLVHVPGSCCWASRTARS